MFYVCLAYLKEKKFVEIPIVGSRELENVEALIADNSLSHTLESFTVDQHPHFRVYRVH